jgi:hypothetical protein
MTTTINADNGVSSGSAGLKSSADATGVLALQTNGTTAVTVDASQNVGIGTTSPAAKLNVSSSDGELVKISGTTRSLFFRSDSSGVMISTGAAQTGAGTYYSAGSDFIYFMTGSTERARFNSTGALVFAGGTTTANGIGIAFPATQSASSDVNTLDDYEEGTWTTTIGGTANITGTPTLSDAKYTKIGRLVTLEGYFSAQTTSSNTNTYWTFSLPFVTSSNSSGACGAAKQENNFIVGAVSDTSSASNNNAYISYSASAQLPSGTASHSFSYTYMTST